MNKLYYFIIITVFAYGCQRDEYYIDGGLADPNFNGSMMAYLDAHPVQFDTIATIIRLAGLDTLFEEEDITFFAPPDESIKRLIGNVEEAISLNVNFFIKVKIPLPNCRISTLKSGAIIC